jgi:RNA polymerase sigma factor (sigma-70 family)
MCTLSSLSKLHPNARIGLVFSRMVENFAAAQVALRAGGCLQSARVGRISAFTMLSTDDYLNYPEASTAVLTRRAVAGDLAARDELAARTMPQLQAWFTVQLRASRNLGVEPSDCVNEVWVRAVAGLKTMNPDAGSIRAWLFGIAHNVMNELRHRVLRRGGGVSGQNVEQILSMHEDSITRISQIVARSEQQQILRKLLDDLDPDEMLLLSWHGLEDRTLSEVAEKLGISHDAASKRWQRLRKRLQERELASLFELEE